MVEALFQFSELVVEEVKVLVSSCHIHPLPPVHFLQLPVIYLEVCLPFYDSLGALDAGEAGVGLCAERRYGLRMVSSV